MMVKKFFTIAFLILVTACGGEIKNVSFAEDVNPIIVENCLICHNGEKEKGTLNFESYEKLISSRYLNRSESLVIEGDAAQSRLYLVVNSNNPAIRMPPKIDGYNKLSGAEIKTIKVWINEGAQNN